MFKIKTSVSKLENNCHAVFIDTGDNPVLYKIHNDNVETALCEILEYLYGDCDFDYVCRYKVGVWYIYDVEIIDDVE